MLAYTASNSLHGAKFILPIIYVQVQHSRGNTMIFIEFKLKIFLLGQPRPTVSEAYRRPGIAIHLGVGDKMIKLGDISIYGRIVSWAGKLKCKMPT